MSSFIVVFRLWMSYSWYCIGTELLAGGDVWTYVREAFPLHVCPVPLAHSYGSQLLRGLAHLKAHRVVHNDIKLENLLLDGT